MDSNYLQQQRFLLQKKVKRLNSCNFQVFHSLLVQFWGYVRAHALYGPVLAKLDAEALKFEQEVAAVSRGEVLLFETEREFTQFNYRLLEYCAEQPLGKGHGPEI